jgi:hypothetical protein
MLPASITMYLFKKYLRNVPSSRLNPFDYVSDVLFLDA